MSTFTEERNVALPVDKVWEFLGDFSQSPGPEIDVVIEKEGDSAANGVGMIRNIKIGNNRIREILESAEPPNSFTYRILDGAPLKEYLGTVTFEENNGLTKICWHGEFKPKVPLTGFILSKGLKRGVNTLIDVLEKNHV